MDAPTAVSLSVILETLVGPEGCEVVLHFSPRRGNWMLTYQKDHSDQEIVEVVSDTVEGITRQLNENLP